MPRITKPLNDKQILNAKPRDKEYNLRDGQGLLIRIRPNGTKQWLFDYYKPYTKVRALIGFGTYPETTLEQARNKRLEARVLLSQNIDPKEHRDDSNRSIQEAHQQTLENVSMRWFELKKSKVTEDTAKDIWRSLEKHILPELGSTPIHKIKAGNAIKVLESIAANGSLETVKRLCQRLNEIATYAVNTGLMDHNPLSGIKEAFERPNKHNMPALRPAELPELLQALNKANVKRLTRCLIEWQLHTMTRPSEASGARWSEIDIENELWNIPAERMKKRRPHSIPLSKQALAILETLKPISGHREFLFTSNTDYSQPMNSQTANMAIKRMGFGGKLVAHGLRSIASTALNEHGFNPEVIEAALAHVDKDQVRSAYNRAEYIDKRRVMMAWWSEYIENAASNKINTYKQGLALRTI